MPRATVLCVDDEAIILQGLREQLRRGLGGEVDIELAESGEEGLELLDELTRDGGTVALVISDQLMPGMRGEAFLAEVHQRDPRILTVLLTGQATADAVGLAVNNARLYRYIGKPWDEGDLLLTLRGALATWTQAREIERQEAEARRAHEASLRFVPREFLRLLGRERLVDVRYGDHVVQDMHVLLSDMRAYTSLVEGKSTADAFAFVNAYLQRLEAPIREHGGFICNVEGDAVLALFPGRPGDALRAGIASHRALEPLNAERRARGEPDVGMGVGVSSGPLLLGTLGSEERLRCDVVGDAVNLASRVESLTKTYGTRMFVSGHTVQALDEQALDEELALRWVDRVQVKGRQEPVDLYDVLDALPADCRARRLRTRAAFEEGGAHLRAGQIGAALAAFQSVLADDPEDRAATVLASRCQAFQRDGLPEEWTGEFRLTHK